MDIARVHKAAQRLQAVVQELQQLILVCQCAFPLLVRRRHCCFCCMQPRTERHVKHWLHLASSTSLCLGSLRALSRNPIMHCCIQTARCTRRQLWHGRVTPVCTLYPRLPLLRRVRVRRSIVDTPLPPRGTGRARWPCMPLRAAAAFAARIWPLLSRHMGQCGFQRVRRRAAHIAGTCAAHWNGVIHRSAGGSSLCCKTLAPSTCWLAICKVSICLKSATTVQQQAMHLAIAGQGCSRAATANIMSSYTQVTPTRQRHTSCIVGLLSADSAVFHAVHKPCATDTTAGAATATWTRLAWQMRMPRPRVCRTAGRRWSACTACTGSRWCQVGIMVQ